MGIIKNRFEDFFTVNKDIKRNVLVWMKWGKKEGFWEFLGKTYILFYDSVGVVVCN